MIPALSEYDADNFFMYNNILRDATTTRVELARKIRIRTPSVSKFPCAILKTGIAP